MKVYIDNLEQMRRLAEELATRSSIGDCYALYGNLGVGKSTFSRYFIQKLNNSISDIPSPTFSIMQQYLTDSCDILHVDCYRLEEPEAIFNIGLLDLIPESIALIEWPERIEKYLPPSTKHLHFYFSENGRIIEFYD